MLRLLMTLTAGAFIAIPTAAQERKDTVRQTRGDTTAAASRDSTTASGRDQKDPKLSRRADHSWISIDGTVEKVQRDRFTLKYGKGSVVVEMDDRDRDAEGYQLRSGDKVRVQGRIDKQLFDSATIEAGSVFVENLGTYFFASAADEEQLWLHANVRPIDVSSTTIRGRVTAVNSDNFMIRAGTQTIQVDVKGLSANPIDSVGYHRVRVGDVVSVSGELDTEFFDMQPEIEATSVVTIAKSKQGW